MPQTLKCTHCGAVMKSANPIAAGKKVKCAKCAQVFTVADEEEVKEEPAAAEEEKTTDKDEGDEDEKPKKKGKGGDDEAKTPPKKGKGLMIGLIVGGLLLCCCCGGGGTGGYFGYTKLFATTPVHGSWQRGKDFDGVQIQFMRAGLGRYDDALIQLKALADKKTERLPNFKYTMVDDKTIDLAMNDSGDKFWFGSDKGKVTFVVAGDSLTLTPTTGDKKEALAFTRMKDK